MGLFDSLMPGENGGMPNGGLLGATWSDPRTIGLLTAAAQMLQASGPSPVRRNFGQIAAQGLLGGMQGYQGAQRSALEEELRNLQMGEIKRRQSGIDAIRNQLPENLRGLLDVAPDQVVGQMFKAREKPQLVEVQGPDGKTVKRWIRPGESTGVDVGMAPAKERPIPEGMTIGPDGSLQVLPGYLEMKKQIAAAGRQPAQPYFQFLPTEGGYAVGNARTGQVAPVTVGGAPIMRASDSPVLQGRIAEAKEAGKTLGEDRMKAQIDAPRVVQNAETALRMSDELLSHPGFRQAVGASSMFGIQKIPGTQARDFMNRLDQIKGGAFLEAFNTLKGGGQITEVEGKKATDAIARMDNATSEPEFIAAVRDFQSVIRAGMNRAKMRAGAQPNTDGSGAKFLGFE